MAAPMVSVVGTSVKTSSLGDICIVCGFSFIEQERKSDGTVTIKKHYNRKYKLTDERILKIEKVIRQKVIPGNFSGVCTACFREIEKVINFEKEIEELKTKLSDSFSSVNMSLTSNLRSQRRQVIGKRKLRNPADSEQVNKKLQSLINIAPKSEHHAITIPFFVGLTDKPSMSVHQQKEPEVLLV